MCIHVVVVVLAVVGEVNDDDGGAYSKRHDHQLENWIGRCYIPLRRFVELLIG